GVTLHYDGTRWALVPAPAFASSPGASDLIAVWTEKPGDAWAVGDGEVVLHWDGSSWQHVVAPSMGALLGVWGSSSQDVWAVGLDEGSGFFRHWDGSSWDYNWYGLGGFWGVWGSDPNDVWVVGTGDRGLGSVFRYDGVALNQMEFSGPHLR